MELFENMTPKRQGCLIRWVQLTGSAIIACLCFICLLLILLVREVLLP